MSAKTIATTMNVTFEPLRDAPPLSAARVVEVPDINVLLYTDRTQRRTKPPSASPARGETTTGSRGRGTRNG
jgi:hypothetical protein